MSCPGAVLKRRDASSSVPYTPAPGPRCALMRSRDVKQTIKGVRAPVRERAASALQNVSDDRSYQPRSITDHIAYALMLAHILSSAVSVVLHLPCALYAESRASPNFTKPIPIWNAEETIHGVLVCTCGNRYTSQVSCFLCAEVVVCDYVQALWMDGLVSLGDVVSARERSELMEVVREKDLRIRTDTYEIILESIGEQQLL